MKLIKGEKDECNWRPNLIIIYNYIQKQNMRYGISQRKLRVLEIYKEEKVFDAIKIVLFDIIFS